MRTELKRPVGGTQPPDAVALPDGERLFLAPLAHEVTRRFLAEFPEDLERYGDAAYDWGVHDTQWLLAWAATATEVGTEYLVEKATWLGRVLEAREYPLGRLVRDLELAAEAVRAAPGAAREQMAAALDAAADALRH